MPPPVGGGNVAGCRVCGVELDRFGVLADLVRALLSADTSALMLVAESSTAEEFVSAVAPRGGQVGRRELSDELVEQLRLAATRK